MQACGGVEISLHALLKFVVHSVPDRFASEKDNLPNWTGGWAPQLSARFGGTYIFYFHL